MAGSSKTSEKKYIVVELLATGVEKPISKSIERVVKEMRKYELSIKQVQKRYTELQTARDDAMKTGWSSVDGQRKSLADINKLIAKNNEQWKRHKTNLDSNRKAFNQYKGDVVKGSKDITKAQKDQTDQTSRQEKSMKDLTVQLISTAAAYAMLKRTLTFLVSSFTDFEYTLMNVQTLLNETDRTLAKGSIDLMKKYGFSIEDTNKALFDAISAMIPARSSIEFLNEASRLAVGGVTDLKVAVDGLTSIINAYSLEVSEAGRVADAFFRAQKWGKTTVQELVENIGRLAPVAAIAGISYQEMLSALSELTLGGLDTRESVTVLRQAIAGLIKPAAEAEEALRKYNVPVGIAAVSNAGLSYSLGKLMEAYGEFPDIVAEMIPNIRAFTGVTALTAQRLQHMNMITKDVTNNWGEFSSLTTAFAKQMTTNEMKIRRFRAELKALGIEYGEKLKPLFVFALENFRAISSAVIGLTVAFGSYIVVARVIPAINRAIIASFTSMKGAIAGATAGLSLIAGILVTTFLWKKPVDELATSFRNIEGQINTTSNALNYYFDEIKKANSILNNVNATEDEHRQALKDKNDAIIELNTSYGEYISEMITEQTEVSKLNELQEQANKILRDNIALRNKKAESERLQQELIEKTDPQFEKIDELLNTFGVEKTEQRGIFYSGMSKMMFNYEKQREELYEREIAGLKGLQGQALENAKRGYAESAEKLREELDKNISDLFKELFGTEFLINPDAQVSLSTAALRAYENIVNSTEDFAKAYAEVVFHLKLFTDDLKEIKEPDQIRGRSPEAIRQFLSSGYDQKATAAGIKYRDDLTEDYDEWRQSLFDDYWSTVTVLASRTLAKRAELEKDLALSNEEITARLIADPELIALEQKSIDSWKRVATSIKDEEKSLVDQYNFYTKSALDATEELTDAQEKDLKFARIKWFQQLRKAQADHDSYMLNMKLGYVEDEINTFEEGYNKEFQLLQVNYLKKIALIKSNHEKEVAERVKTIEDLQLTQTEYITAFNEMIQNLEKEHNAKMLQEFKIYIEQRMRLVDQMNREYEDFSDKYIDGDNKIIQFLKTRESVYRSIIDDYNKLNIDQDLIDKLLSKSVSLDKINAELEKLGKFSKNSEEALKLLFDALEKYYDITSLEGRKLILSQEEEFGIVGLQQRFEMEVEILNRDIEAYEKGLKKFDKLLHEEDKIFDEAELERKKDLAKRALEINQSGDVLKKKREFGVQTYGDEYAQAYKIAIFERDLGNITDDELDRYLKELRRKYPKFIQNLTEIEFERIQAIGNRVLDITSGVVDQMFQMRADADQREYERQMELLQDKHDTELDLLKNRLDKGLISEERYNKQKEQIDAKYRRREEEQKKRQFKRDQDRAAAQAIIQGAIAAIRAYADLGPIGGILGAALVAAETAANVALIYSQKYAKGGLRGDKVGMIGGNKHSAGGTKFFGEDGSVFEAERGELMAIINAQDTALLSSLNSLNSIHGKPFFKDGGLFDDGGMFMRNLRNSTGFSMKDFAKVLESMPNPVVSVDEIINKTNKMTNVRNAAKV